MAKLIVDRSYFKYYNFFITTIGFSNFNSIILPLGISFYTFTQIAYLVDTYRGEVKDFSLLKYTLFITYFPHLIAGPIIHHKEVMPQFSTSLKFNLRCLNIGFMIFIVGLIKKMIFADNSALLCDPIFQKSLGGAHISFIEGWVAAISYTFQLYFDFSGYCDMAIGLSYIFGVRLPINFHSPYKAKNIIDFWRRWHITLSRFLRDYVYIPLGGNRKGPHRRFINLFTTMFVGGVWHGAGWTFIIWGALHGLYLIINHGWILFKESFPTSVHLRPSLTTALTALILSPSCASWLNFRASLISMPHEYHITHKMSSVLLPE